MSIAPRKPATVTEAVRVPLPTPYGEFLMRAFESLSGHIYLALSVGEVDGPVATLTRIHSECLTGEVLGSLRCECGVQLRTAMREIAAEGRGVIVYATGHEGRGIGLINKLRAYVEQDAGADTIDANVRLGFDADARDYGDAAAVLAALGVRAVRLLSNNPLKAAALVEAGIDVADLCGLATSAHARNWRYLATKQHRLGHRSPVGAAPDALRPSAVDVSALLGAVGDRKDRPYVVLKYAQTLDGRIATGTGDSKWISGEEERALSHAMRAACDAVLVGVGTVLRDDPQLTVRMVPGVSPLRVALDSTLRVPPDARLLSGDASTLLLTTDRSPDGRREELRRAGIGVRVVPSSPNGVDPRSALAQLRAERVRTLLVEGGARVITSLLAAGLVDRVVVSISPRIIGAGTEAVGDLQVSRVADGMRLSNRSVHLVGDDMVAAWDVAQN